MKWSGYFLLGVMLLAGCMKAGTAAPLRTVQAPDSETAPATLFIETAAPVNFAEPTKAASTQTPFQPQLPTQPPTPKPTATATPLPSPTPTPTQFEWIGPVVTQKAYPGAPQPLPVLTGADTLDLLLIGSDARGDGSFRTDTMVILIIWPEQQAVSMISIPRDLYVYIPGWQENRINTAYLHGKLTKYPGGGPALLKDTILYNLGIRIDRTAMLDFNGFMNVVDSIGGIDVPLACEFTDWQLVNAKRNAEIPSNWKLLSIGPGVVHMNGDLALWYARSRMRSNDFDRGRRQQEVLRAIYSKGMQLNLVPQIPSLYEQLKDSFTTDISLADLLSLAPMAVNMDEANIRSFYLSSKMVTGWMTPGGASVLLPKRGKILEMLKDALSPPDQNEKIRLATLVEVYNASGHSEWDRLAAERLHYAGYETRLLTAGDLGVDPAQVNSQTILYDMTADQNAQLAARVLAALGLSESRLNPAPMPESTASFRLILGKDYRPCFKPAKLSH